MRGIPNSYHEPCWLPCRGGYTPRFPERMNDLIKQCIICHKEFETTQPSTKTCGDRECLRKRNNEIMAKWQRRHRAETKEIFKTFCPECGKPFETSNATKIYCCSDCQIAHNSRKKYQRRTKPKAPAKRNRTSHQELVDASMEARAAGLSYGQWQAMKEGRLKC